MPSNARDVASGSRPGGSREVVFGTVLAEAQELLLTTELPKGRSQRAAELLTAAVHLADDLLSESPAVALGKKGGKQTAKRWHRLLPKNRCHA